MIEEAFLTQEEQQFTAWGISVGDQSRAQVSTSNQDSEYAYTSLYDNTSTVIESPKQSSQVINNEIQGSFVFRPQNTVPTVTPKLSIEEQDKQDFLTYYKQGLTEQAIEKGQSLLEANPQDSNMLYNLSLLHVKRKEYSEAKDYADKLIKLSNDNYQGHYLNGVIAYYNQDVEQAKTALEKAISLNDNSSSAWLYLGHLFNYAEQYTEAKRSFEKVIDLQGESASIYYNLAVLSQKLNQPKEGVYYYQKSLDLGGKIDVDLASKLLRLAQ